MRAKGQGGVQGARSFGFAQGTPRARRGLAQSYAGPRAQGRRATETPGTGAKNPRARQRSTRAVASATEGTWMDDTACEGAAPCSVYALQPAATHPFPSGAQATKVEATPCTSRRVRSTCDQTDKVVKRLLKCRFIYWVCGIRVVRA